MSIDDSEIEALAEGPLKTRTEEGMVEERPIDELIRARRELSASSTNVVPWGIRFATAKPGGTV